MSASTGRSLTMPKHTPTHLDPRAPLVLDTRELPRRPGALRTVTRVVPAPSDLGLELIGVPEGADLSLDLRLESVSAVVLALPTNPLCRDDCPGLCPDCGVPLDELPEGHSHEQVDPRWAALSNLT